MGAVTVARWPRVRGTARSSSRRDRARRVLVNTELATGGSALLCGGLLALRPDGSLLGLPTRVLVGGPFVDWRLPGLLLAGLVGVGYLAAGLWQLRRYPYGRELSALAGTGLVVFEVTEWGWLGFNPLQAVFMAVGAAVVGLAVAVGDGARIDRADQPRVGIRSERGSSALAWVLWLLAAGMAVCSLLGPVGVGAMTYRTSPTSLNQLRGSDAATLFLIAPLALAAAALARRRHPAAPLLATGIGAYALYIYAQVVIGQEYLRLPGNVEKFFPLLLTVFVLAGAAVVLGQRATPDRLPALSERMSRVVGVVLLCVAAFLVVGLHLPSMVTAWKDPMSMSEYASSPTPFWMVKLMDLGIVVPIAVTTGIGLLRGAAWAPRVMYPLLMAYSCLSTSVATMGLVMVLRDDPDASVSLLGGFIGFALLFATLTAAAYRPLFGKQPVATAV